NGGGQVAIAFAQNQEGAVLSGDVMQSLGTNANATGRNAPTVAFTLHGSDGTVSAASSTDVAGSLRTRAPGSIENSSTTAVLQEQPVAWSGETFLDCVHVDLLIAPSARLHTGVD